MALLNSAGGVLSLLDEPDDVLKVHALKQLNTMVDHFWSEIASSISKIETLFESDEFKDRELAASVASKVFYHLEELDDALKYALGAGDYFDVSKKSEYTETLIAKCIDDYISLHSRKHDEKEEKLDIDARLEAVVNRMFDRCFDDGEYKQALGIALEARRLDIIRTAIQRSGHPEEMLSYCFQLAQSTVSNREFRQEVLRVLVDLYKSLPTPDYLSMCQSLLFLGDYQSVANILQDLIKEADNRTVKDFLLAYQIAFDLNENQNQAFLAKVSNALPKPEEEPSVTATTSTTATTTTTTPAADNATPSTTDADASAASKTDSYNARLKKLHGILTSEIPVDLYLHFLYTQNKSDANILKLIKEKLEPRNTVTHNATVMSHAMMQCGTTIDSFLRDDLAWLGKATNWAKFTATASIGVIHKGHYKESLKILQPYLPQPGQTSSPYQEGGALYALGLIHANLSGANDKTQYLQDALRNASNNEILQHGACLGLGLTAMASGNEALFEVLKNIVYTDAAIAGEGAGLSMGLVMLGTGHGESIQEMLSYAQETKHEKIIRGLALGMALICYGQEESADTVIATLLKDKDPLLRYGGVYAIAMAYVGTANNDAVKKLLHYAVSDVSDDVRRGAVSALGFVLCNVPHQVPRIVGLLAESFNPHVRYAACIAVGIACAGTGLKEALDLIEPLLKDRIDYVRQGACIGLSMVLIQHNKNKEPRVETLRKFFTDTVSAKGDTMTKFGCILGSGILDAGGRNVTISLLSAAGHKRMAAVAGMAVFLQFWYWYPLVHFLSLSFTPTAVIGLNKDLKMPQDFTFTSNAAPSLYQYPEPIEVKKEEKKKKVATAELSVTAKAKAKAAKKKNESGESDDKSAPMEVDESDEEKKKKDAAAAATTSADKKDGDKMEVDTEDKKAETSTTDDKKTETVEPPKPEAKFATLKNPSRVTWSQQKILTFDSSQRYQPIKKQLGGIVLLRDSKPEEQEQIYTPADPKIGVPGVSDDEPAPPQPFQIAL